MESYFLSQIKLDFVINTVALIGLCINKKNKCVIFEFEIVNLNLTLFYNLLRLYHQGCNIQFAYLPVLILHIELSQNLRLLNFF